MHEALNEIMTITLYEEYVSPNYYSKSDVPMVHIVAETAHGLAIDIDVSKTFNQGSKLTQILAAVYNISWRQVYSQYGQQDLSSLVHESFLADVHVTEPSVITKAQTYYIDNIRPQQKKELASNE